MDYSFYDRKIQGGIGADDRYWESLEEGKFRLSRCPDCKTWIWPAHWRCGLCGSWELEWAELDPIGVVYSWTRSWYAFDRTKQRAPHVPYVVVLAEIPDADGVRVIGALKGNEHNLRIGAQVRGSIDPPSELSMGYPALRWELVR